MARKYASKATKIPMQKALKPAFHAYIEHKDGLQNIFSSEELNKIKEIKIRKESYQMETENRALMKRLDFLIESDNQTRLERHLLESPMYLSSLINDAIKNYLEATC